MSTYNELSPEEKKQACRRWKSELASLGLTQRRLVEFSKGALKYNVLSDWINGWKVASPASYELVEDLLADYARGGA